MPGSASLPKPSCRRSARASQLPSSRSRCGPMSPARSGAPAGVALVLLLAVPCGAEPPARPAGNLPRRRGAGASEHGRGRRRAAPASAQRRGDRDAGRADDRAGGETARARELPRARDGGHSLLHRGGRTRPGRERERPRADSRHGAPGAGGLGRHATRCPPPAEPRPAGCACRPQERGRRGAGRRRSAPEGDPPRAGTWRVGGPVRGGRGAGGTRSALVLRARQAAGAAARRPVPRLAPPAPSGGGGGTRTTLRRPRRPLHRARAPLAAGGRRRTGDRLRVSGRHACAAERRLPRGGRAPEPRARAAEDFRAAGPCLAWPLGTGAPRALASGPHVCERSPGDDRRRSHRCVLSARGSRGAGAAPLRLLGAER